MGGCLPRYVGQHCASPGRPGEIPNMLCPWGTPGHPGVPRQNRSYCVKLWPGKKKNDERVDVVVADPQVEHVDPYVWAGRSLRPVGMGGQT